MNITASTRSQARSMPVPNARTYDPTFGEFNYVPARSTIQCSRIGSNNTCYPTLKESANERNALNELNASFYATASEFSCRDYLFSELLSTWTHNAELNRITAVHIEISAEELEQQEAEQYEEAQQWYNQEAEQQEAEQQEAEQQEAEQQEAEQQEAEQQENFEVTWV